jgi:predicted nucleic acid-binding protein
VTIKRLVVDASVALKWVLRDEEATLQADALLTDLLAGRLSLFVPTLFDYEITNALKVTVAKGRIAESKAQTALADFRLYSIERMDFLPGQDAAFKFALQYNRSVYDSAYLALAQSLGSGFSLATNACSMPLVE